TLARTTSSPGTRNRLEAPASGLKHAGLAVVARARFALIARRPAVKAGDPAARVVFQAHADRTVAVGATVRGNADVPCDERYTARTLLAGGDRSLTRAHRIVAAVDVGEAVVVRNDAAARRDACVRWTGPARGRV